MKKYFFVFALLIPLPTMDCNAQDLLKDDEHKSSFDRLYQYVDPYSTPPKGEFELEYRFEHMVYGSEGGGNPYPNQWGHRIGLETGIVSNLMVEVYTLFQQPEVGNNKVMLANLSFEMRYSVVEHNIFIVDPAIALEYKKGFSGRGSGVEGKFILAKDIGRLNFVGNLSFESSGVEAGGSNKSGFELGFNFGAAYLLTDWLAIGTEYEHEFLGPTIGIMFEHLRMNISAGSALEGQASNYPPMRFGLVYRF